MPDSREVVVLLVEDSPQDAEITIRTLKKKNLVNSVVHLKDGQEALDWLFQEGPYAGRSGPVVPKVILLDLKLPKVDGLEVLKAIRADDRTRLIPVVIMTSSLEERDLVQSYSLGVNSYIVKPVDFENFSAAVAEAGHYWLLVNQNPLI
ncbi:MAG: response regulator [Candidatus Methylacidiphilales bacterium]|nr:response regulator [Candidatus Methylacidiphilales bacterium]